MLTQLHHAWGSMVDRAGVRGLGPLFHLRKLRGDGTVNDSQAPRDFQRPENPHDFTAGWLQGLVDADVQPYQWSHGSAPLPMPFEPAAANQPRPRWFVAPWGHGLTFFENGQRFTYDRPVDYWKSDFTIAVECNTANPRTDGHVVWGDPSVGWLKVSGLRAAHFALTRGSSNPELHAPDPKRYPLGLVGHVRLAVVVNGGGGDGAEVLIVCNGERIYQGSTTGASVPGTPTAPAAWGGIVGHGNNFQGELCGGAHINRALSLHEAQALTT